MGLGFGQAVVWFFGRWVDTYLMPADAGRGPNSTPSSNEGDQQQMGGTAGPQLQPLVVAFGEEGGGKAVLEVLVRVAVSGLISWPGERTLQASCPPLFTSGAVWLGARLLNDNSHCSAHHWCVSTYHHCAVTLKSSKLTNQIVMRAFSFTWRAFLMVHL